MIVPYGFVILAGLCVVVANLQAALENFASRAAGHWRIIGISFPSALTCCISSHRARACVCVNPVLDFTLRCVFAAWFLAQCKSSHNVPCWHAELS